MPVECPICMKKYKTDGSYIKHLEREHKNGCGCGVGGGRLLKKDFDEKMERLREKIKKVDADIAMNVVRYDLKMNDRELEGIPVMIREKIRGLVMENEYLRGQIKGQEEQIKLMKRQVNKCIESAGIHLEVRE